MIRSCAPAFREVGYQIIVRLHVEYCYIIIKMIVLFACKVLKFSVYLFYVSHPAMLKKSCGCAITLEMPCPSDDIFFVDASQERLR